MNKSTEPGFGLLEVLMAMLILGIMTSSAYYFLNNQRRSSVQANDMSKGMLLGKQTLDSLRMGAYEKVVTDCDTVESRYVRTWRVSTDLKNNRKSVSVVVSWPLSMNHKVSYATTIADDKFKISK